MLENIDLFSFLPKDSLAQLEIFCQERFLNTGEVLFSKGEDSTGMYIVKTGKLEVYDENKIYGYINPGDFVGEMALFSLDKKRTASVKAVEQTSIIVLLDFAIKELGQKHPEILLQIQDIIQKRETINKY
ncbi:cyclic nucleotide-binding domain-containing protein [Candidatus Gracilibacteria bacterium]|nr:cyclic nucleotide-binding domain-containing protein [Candidatus Gracilibacteria bacterium]